MNKALGGGLAYGRQVLVYGSKSSGKSSFSLQIVADAQRNGKLCAWIDSENSFDPEWASKLGVDIDELIVARAHTINHVVDIGIALMKNGVDLLVIDSVTACLPAVFFDKKDNMKELVDTKQIGSDARDWSHALKMLNYANDNTLLILISQQRKSFGQMFAKNIPTGGEAMRFFSSTIIKLWSSDSEAQAVKSKVDMGTRTIEVPVGREINWLIEANKLGPAFQSGAYRFMFIGDNVGVDVAGEIATSLELSGHAKMVGAWIHILDEKFHGRENFINAIREDMEFRKKIEQLLEN